MSVERAVLDTNVFISATISPAGKPFGCLTWAATYGAIVGSEGLLQEFESRLSRERIERLVREPHRSQVVALLREAALIVEPAAMDPVCRDPADDLVLATAIAGGADCIVTGDQDLLVLGPFRGIRILTPAAFLIAVDTDEE